MNDRDETTPEIAALRERASKLSAASLRIGASLDLGTVLREVVDGARALTGARYGASSPPSARWASPGLHELRLHAGRA